METNDLWFEIHLLGTKIKTLKEEIEDLKLENAKLKGKLNAVQDTLQKERDHVKELLKIQKGIAGFMQSHGV